MSSAANADPAVTDSMTKATIEVICFRTRTSMDFPFLIFITCLEVGGL